jgi:hypothetical protein
MELEAEPDLRGLRPLHAACVRGLEGRVRGASDYVTVVQALLELEQLFGARATVWDDYYLSDPTAPSEVDTAALSERIREEYEDTDSDDVDALEQELEESEEESPDDDAPSEPRARPQRPGEQARADFEIWKRAQEKKKG